MAARRFRASPLTLLDMLFSYIATYTEQPVLSLAQWSIWRRLALAAIVVALIWLGLWGLL